MTAKSTILVMVLLIFSVMVRVSYEIWNHAQSKSEYSILDVVDNQLESIHNNHDDENIFILFKPKVSIENHIGIGLREEYCIQCIDCNSGANRTLVLLNPKYKPSENKIAWGINVDLNKKELIKNKILAFKNTGKCEYDKVLIESEH